MGILILHDDKAMLHNWPKNQAPVFHPLQASFTDPRSVWNQNDFWPHESCAVQFKGHVMICSPHDVANDPVNEKEYIDRRCWSTASMEKNSMYWQREASLKTRHINGAMVQHKGRLTMVGGTGSYGGQDSALDTAAVEFLDQNLQLNEDNTLNRWLYGKKYPFAVEEHEIVSVRDGY